MQVATVLDEFVEQGYVVVEDVFDPQRDLQPVVDDNAALLDQLAERWHAEGKLAETYASLPFGQRLARIISESGLDYSQHFDISLPQSGVMADTPIHTSEAVFNLLTHPKLLDIVEMFIGPEIYSNPIQHVRIKPPEHIVPSEQHSSLVVRTPWHQDQGVALPEVDATEMLTVWLPVTDATRENGCLCVVPGSHRGELVTHCPGEEGLHIPGKLLGKSAVTVPMKRGSVLFLHRRTMHCSLPNRSDDIRWSYDLRYQPIGQPTGRPAFPGFIARSRQNPQSALRDYSAWGAMWLAARARLAGVQTAPFNRWTSDAPACS